ncbi:hypothetical protein GCM10027059_25340 [Myceligenerans halotolerans]
MVREEPHGALVEVAPAHVLDRSGGPGVEVAAVLERDPPVACGGAGGVVVPGLVVAGDDARPPAHQEQRAAHRRAPVRPAQRALLRPPDPAVGLRRERGAAGGDVLRTVEVVTHLAAELPRAQES